MLLRKRVLQLINANHGGLEYCTIKGLCRVFHILHQLRSVNFSKIVKEEIRGTLPKCFATISPSLQINYLMYYFVHFQILIGQYI